MLILSKYKDYYDYLVKKHEIDKKVVLDRREGFIVSPYVNTQDYEPEKYEQIHVAICGVLYVALRNSKRYYWLDEIKECGEYKKNWRGEYVVIYDDGYRRKETIKIEKKPTHINDKKNCPIILVSGRWHENGKEFPRLQDLELARIIPPGEIFLTIYSWLSKRNEKVIVDKRTDIEKIENAGFDKKTSFRNM